MHSPVIQCCTERQSRAGCRLHHFLPANKSQQPTINHQSIINQHPPMHPCTACSHPPSPHPNICHRPSLPPPSIPYPTHMHLWRRLPKYHLAAQVFEIRIHGEREAKGISEEPLGGQFAAVGKERHASRHAQGQGRAAGSRQAEGQMMSMSAVHPSNTMRMLSHGNLCIDQIPLSARLTLLHHQLTTC